MERPAMKLCRFARWVPLALACSSLALGALAFVAGIGPAASVVNAVPLPQGLAISCSSDDMQRHWCPVDTRGGAELIKQRSEAKCIFNRTWGYDDRGIWVDRGCRADFQIGGAEFKGWGQEYHVYCASDDMNLNWCPADSRFGVRLARQRSEAGCVMGRTWGYGPRGIWVDHGCRADFRVAGDWENRAAALLYCASDDMQRHGCGIDTRDGVFIIRQRSEADCVFNRTWGYDREGIWVDRGCRADFEVVIVATANGAITTMTTAIAMIAGTATTVGTTMIVGIAMTVATATTGLLTPTEV
jgi:hypothetical protein